MNHSIISPGALTPLLCDDTVDALRPETQRFQYDRNHTNIGIVHFGPGAFHRAHQAYYTDMMMDAVGGHWRICEVSLRSAGTRNALLPQDNLYTLSQLQSSQSFRVIGAIGEFLLASEQIGAVTQRLSNATTQAVTLTVTEKGYCLNSDGNLDEGDIDILRDLANPSQPTTAIGTLVAGLRDRYGLHGQPVAVISCDNLSDNGKKLKGAVCAYANGLDPKLAAWIENHVPFPSTMVDSITPATTDQTRELVFDAIGVCDAAPVQREPFTQWVIENTPDFELPPWESAGAQIVNDVRPFELAKHRILNGLHTSAAFLGLYMGLDTVEQAITHKELRPYLNALCFEEIIPSLGNIAGLDLVVYANDILSRFENPAIRYELTQIAWDTSQKIPYRLLATLSDNVAAGRPVDRISNVVACWVLFLHHRVSHDQKIVDPLAEEFAGVLNVSPDQLPTVVDYLLRSTMNFAHPDWVIDKIERCVAQAVLKGTPLS